MIEYTCIALIAGLLLDFIFGEPGWLYHPVVLIGKLISFFEKRLRAVFPATERGERAAGRFLVVVVCFISTAVPVVLLIFAFGIHEILGVAVMSYMCFRMVAAKSLRQESMKVYHALSEEGLEAGRSAVSRIVGRDTEALDEKGVIKAAVETVAENFSDGVVAPMFYMVIGGPALMYLYKAINTMDSMVGYKNEEYIHFGRAAAKLDDVANWIPARLAAVMLIFAAGIMRLDAGNGIRIWRRDRRNHASPNAAQTESVVAGALGVQLAGNAFYFGQLYEKPAIGDDDREISIEDIDRTGKMMYAGTLITAAAFAGISAVIWILV
ncbi:MAG: cobalamin biosynthesis protein CobD [Firmicutes bacterium]|nr:cobalamin biosynthesis protein CobD [Bacillota bacterium]